MDTDLYNHWLVTGLIGIVIGFAVLILSKVLLNVFAPYHVDEQLTKEDNPAVGIACAGYFASVAIIFFGAVHGPDSDVILPWSDIAAQWGIDIAYVVAGLLLLNLSRYLLDRCIVGQLSIADAIVKDRNIAAGAVEAGALIVSACVIAGGINGEGSWTTALAFYGIGQILTMLFVVYYRWITKYDLIAQLKACNTAAGVAFAMNLVALGIIVLRATSGDFVSWQDNLINLAWYAGGGVLLFTAMRIAVDHAILPKSSLQHEIETDRSLNAAWLEGTLALASAGLIWFML